MFTNICYPPQRVNENFMLRWVEARKEWAVSKCCWGHICVHTTHKCGPNDLRCVGYHVWMDSVTLTQIHHSKSKIRHVRILFPFSQRLLSFYALNIFESHSIHALDAERVFSLSFICVFPFLSVFPISFNDFHAHWLLSRMCRIKSEINKPEK